ncbi:hypothetical protein F4780DRAFT_739521 [Xylariomycetidae sp. FL0641]|nr:hypothetical protein F4780DRAFT_739521 [Xylariomycetidae sp. FL0641]
MGAYAGAKGALDALTKVLAKEVAPFNIRTLTVVLGTFNTDMPKNVHFGKTPLPEDYRGSTSDKVLQWLASGKIPVNGDKDKAMRALYQAVVGEGFAAGREAEKLLLLGPDMPPRVRKTVDYLQHSLDVFEDVANSVALAK